MSSHTSPPPTSPPPFPSPSPLPPDAAASSPSSPSLHPPPITNDTQPPQFTPFFTLLTTSSPTTGVSSTHHPTVTYTFASDPPDTSPITAAALHSLSSPFSPSSPQTPASPQSPPRLREERYILLDLDASGTKVVSAQSMSPAWAVVGTEVGVAPHWEGEGGAAAGNGNDRGLMLKIEGVEAPALKKQVGREEEDDRKGLEQLMEEYENGMRELRRVVEANGDSDTGEDERGGEGSRSIGVPV